MTNREAIEYLNDVRNGIHIPAPGIELPLLNDKEKEAVDLAISALEKQEQDRWIPIAERMPEENDFVLVTVSGEDVRGCEWKDSMALAVWTNQWNLVDANLVSYTISAWRPLPEPYTEEEA